jgi:hypothetical protein
MEEDSEMLEGVGVRSRLVESSSEMTTLAVEIG